MEGHFLAPNFGLLAQKFGMFLDFQYKKSHLPILPFFLFLVLLFQGWKYLLIQRHNCHYWGQKWTIQRVNCQVNLYLIIQTSKEHVDVEKVFTYEVLLMFAGTRCLSCGQWFILMCQESVSPLLQDFVMHHQWALVLKVSMEMQVSWFCSTMEKWKD